MHGVEPAQPAQSSHTANINNRRNARNIREHVGKCSVKHRDVIPVYQLET